MIKHLRYLKYLLRHKLFVGWECLKVGLFWEALVHDLSKFRPIEWNGYVARFASGNDYHGMAGDIRYYLAWNDHQKRNNHHWQHFIMIRDNGETEVLPMPHRARLHMLCDWRGMGKSLGKPDIKGWYLSQRHIIRLHPETSEWIESQLGVEGEGA